MNYGRGMVGKYSETQKRNETNWKNCLQTFLIFATILPIMIQSGCHGAAGSFIAAATAILAVAVVAMVVAVAEGGRWPAYIHYGAYVSAYHLVKMRPCAPNSRSNEGECGHNA